MTNVAHSTGKGKMEALLKMNYKSFEIPSYLHISSWAQVNKEMIFEYSKLSFS